MKLFSSALCILILFSDSESLSTRKLTFKDDRCFGPFNPTPRESFEVNHTTDVLSSICKDMSFSGWDDVDSLKRESCVKVKEFNLDCPQRLQYRTGSSRGTLYGSYGCIDTAANIPVFCTYDLLYIRIETEEKIASTSVVYTVYAGSEDLSDHEAFPLSAVIGPVVVIGLLLLVTCIGVYIRRMRQSKMQNQGGVVTYRQTQQPNVNVHHHNHQGDQGSTPYSNQIQGQPLLPQGYNAPPQAPPQSQIYPQYPSGQQTIPPPPLVQQPINDMSGPPSYGDVTKG